MTIRTDGGELVCECNECGSEVYGGTLNFREFVADLKDQGWKIGKDEDGWSHTCPDCQENTWQDQSRTN